MSIISVKQPDLSVSCSKNIKLPLMVCSHERSGTHFLMNSLSECTHYSVKPYLDYDYSSLGSILNFFSRERVYKFFETIEQLKIDDGSILCVNSLLKSHFSLSLLGNNYDGKCKIVYIYRNPADVFISYWKFLHQLDWEEGPRMKSPMDLMFATPSGQSQRYQMKNYSNYFSRWANHVADSYQVSLTSSEIICINYKDLVDNFHDSIKNICNKLNLSIISQIKKPIRENYILGKEMKLSGDQLEQINKYCCKEIKLYSGLPLDLY